jgi:hypothetical protein
MHLCQVCASWACILPMGTSWVGFCDFDFLSLRLMMLEAPRPNHMTACFVPLDRIAVRLRTRHKKLNNDYCSPCSPLDAPLVQPGFAHCDVQAAFLYRSEQKEDDSMHNPIIHCRSVRPRSLTPFFLNAETSQRYAVPYSIEPSCCGV